MFRSRRSSVSGKDDVEEESVRRIHTPELKRAVLNECRAGMSIASAAMAYGINANLVHKWRRFAQRKAAAVNSGE